MGHKMVITINFSEQFAAAVCTGAKRQTIRGATRARAGNTLCFTTGKNTPVCHKIGEAICKDVASIIITNTYIQPLRNTVIMGVHLDEFAKADGFKNYAEMWAFFSPMADVNREYHGWLIRW